MRFGPSETSIARHNGHDKDSPLTAAADDSSLDFLNVAEVSKLIKQPPSWVRSQTCSRCKDPMPHIKRGGRLFFEEKAVLDWFRAARIAYPNRKR
jgi:hypothetical protein